MEPRAYARALDAERDHARAWLHDRVLRMLDYVAAGGGDEPIDVARLQAVAGLAADELRAFVEGDAPPPGSDLVTALVDVVSRAQRSDAGPEVEVVIGGGDADVDPELATAFAAATGEAMRARESRARVTCAVRDGHAVVTVDGAGVVAEAGLARVRAAGGTARLDPGRLVLCGPLRRPAFVVELGP